MDKGNKYNFKELIAKYEVRIPIIQRDYAQGRQDEKASEVRKNLIKDLLSCLKDENKTIDFNFVYGNVSDDVFFPVDGQQRLTTLYLLYWYLAVCSDNSDFNNFKRFSYMTRSAATEFFALLKACPDGLTSIISDEVDISDKIKNQPWFQAEWSNDPTVDSALTMLNDLSNISDFRNNAPKFYEGLDRITFTLIIEQAEDAEMKAAKSYIRMNARGKALEPFENVKAMLDSIDGKLQNRTDIIDEYDKKYINTFYSRCSSPDLNVKTNEINKASLNCFKNLYNLCRQINNQSTKNTDTEYISRMYEYSQNKFKKEDTGFFEKYFNMVKAVLDYYCTLGKDTSNYIQDVFQDCAYGYNTNNHRLSVAVILYIYYYKPVTEEDMKLYCYVLNNLKFTEWGNYLLRIKAFAEAVSSKSDVSDYFINKQCADIQKLLAETNLDDINVRLQEQKIKFEIIKTNNISDNYHFNTLEEQSGNRKIQYLLYISDYWNGTGDYAKLEKYIECAKKWFKNQNNDLEWRKYYAIGINIDSNGNLLSSSDINSKCGDSHIWNDSYYFWNDNSSPASQLDNVKKTYDNEVKISGYITNLPNDQNYNDCWLKYAVKYHKLDLLNRKLSFNNSEVTVFDDGVYHLYMLYVMKLVKNAQWGLKDFTASARSEFGFKANYRYTHSTNSNWFFDVGGRNYIMRLKAPVTITISNLPASKECVYCYENNCKYTIYQYISKNPSLFNKFEYDMANDIANRDTKINNYKNIINGYQKDDFLEIKARINANWIQQGRSAEWAYSQKVITATSTPTQGKELL